MKRDTVLGLVIGACLVGCAGAAYQTYGLDIPDGCYKAGKLLGHDPSGSQDRPFTECQPDPEPSPGASPVAIDKMKCRILKESEFVRMDSDLVTCQALLKTCPQP